MLEGIEQIIKETKNNKSPGHDKITNEHIKLGGVEMVKYLTKLFNNILKAKIIPSDWSLQDTIIIFKKEDRHKIENYRPITLGTTISKIFSKALEKRLKPIIMAQQPIEQAGFRKQYSTMDHLHAINQLIEKLD